MRSTHTFAHFVRRFYAVRRLVVSLVVVLCILILSACQSTDIHPGHIDPDKLHIVEQSSKLLESSQEVINLENCGGSADVERVITNRVDSEVYVSAQLNADLLVWLEGQVDAYYQTAWSSERTLHLKALPATHVIYVVTWEQKVRAGDLIYDDIDEKGSYRTTEVTYSAVESKDVKCPQGTGAPALPTYPSEPTPASKVVFSGYAQSAAYLDLAVTQVVVTGDATIVTFRIKATENTDNLMIHGPGSADAFYLVDGDLSSQYALVDKRGPVTFDQRFSMASGDICMFQLIFEPLGRRVTTINIIEGAHINPDATYWDIYNLELER